MQKYFKNAVLKGLPLRQHYHSDLKNFFEQNFQETKAKNGKLEIGVNTKLPAIQVTK